jgi:threonine aldolase
MRQAGILAAAGLVALEHMVARLADDHRRAGRIAAGLHGIAADLCDPRQVETNIVMVDLAATGADAAAWVAALAGRGVRAGTWSGTQLRLVTHRHITDRDVDATVTAFRAAHEEVRASPAPRRVAGA